MKTVFKVHSCEPQKVSREVSIDGQNHVVEVPAVIAQLVPIKEDGTGTIKLAVSGSDEDKATFEPGGYVSVEVLKAEAPAEEGK